MLSTEWVDYVEEPKKYQALRPHLFSMVGGWRVLGVGGGGVSCGVGGWVMVGWVMGWVGGGGVGGVGDGGVVSPHDTSHHGGHQMPPY